MKGAKTTIKKKIFLSHIAIIVISLLLTFLSFNLYLNYYIEKQAKSDFAQAKSSIEEVIVENTQNIEVNKASKNSVLNQKIVSRIRKTLKNTGSFLDINYAVIDKNLRIIYPVDNSVKEERLQDYDFVQNNIISLLDKKSDLLKNNYNEKSIEYFQVSGRRYGTVVYPIQLSNQTYYIAMYSDMIKSNAFVRIVNNILLVILFITAAISVLISNSVSKKISMPISKLKDYARRIGDRKYDSKLEVCNTNDEIGELTNTLQIMAGKLEAYDGAMKGFMQNASHELRTPLMSIQGYAEGLKYEVVEDREKAVDIIIEESKRLSDLVEDLLYLSNLEGMQDRLNLEKIKVEELLKSSIERVNGIAVKEHKKIALNTNTENSNVIIHGDEEKLIRAILNILGNCLRYCKETINVSLKQDNSQAIIIIEDDGKGFVKEDIPNIFERFYKGKGGKYGIGLAITKTIIEKHGGNISAENRLEGGARFIIKLS